jgi:hypothetical protein
MPLAFSQYEATFVFAKSGAFGSSLNFHKSDVEAIFISGSRGFGCW